MESDDSHNLSDESEAPYYKDLEQAKSNRSLNMRKSLSVTPQEQKIEQSFAARLSEKEVENVVTSNPNSVAARLLKRTSIMPDEFTMPNL